MYKNESLGDFVKRLGQAVLQVESYSMDIVSKSLKGVSARVHPSLYASPRSLRKLWTFCSNAQINAPCLRTKSEQPLSRFWSPVNLPRTTQLGAPKTRASEGKRVKGKVDHNSQAKPASPPSAFHMRNSSPLSASYLISDVQSQ